MSENAVAQCNAGPVAAAPAKGKGKEKKTKGGKKKAPQQAWKLSDFEPVLF